MIFRKVLGPPPPEFDESELFPDFNFYEMYHGMSEKPGEVLNQFDNDPGKAMLVSIGMLLEGVGISLFKFTRRIPCLQY